MVCRGDGWALVRRDLKGRGSKKKPQQVSGSSASECALTLTIPENPIHLKYGAYLEL